MTTLPTPLPRLRRPRRLWAALAALAGTCLAALALLAPGPGPRAVTQRWLSTEDPDIRLQLFRPGDPAPAGGFPVIFFNPGWRSSLEAYGLHLRVLADGGYVVLAVERSPVSTAWQGDLDLSSDESFAATLDRADWASRIEASEMTRLLDEIGRKGIEGTPLNLDRVGVSGHSFGGTVALQTALSDPRFRAAVNIDGWQFAEAAHQIVRKPVLILTDTAERPAFDALTASDPNRRHEAVLNARNADWIALQSSRSDADIVTIPEAGHGAYIRKGGWRGLAEEIAVRLGRRQDVAGIADRALQDFFRRSL